MGSRLEEPRRATLDAATGWAESAACGVDDVITDLSRMLDDLGDAITRCDAIGVYDKSDEAASAKELTETLKSQAIALKDGIKTLVRQIKAISG